MLPKRSRQENVAIQKLERTDTGANIEFEYFDYQQGRRISFLVYVEANFEKETQILFQVNAPLPYKTMREAMRLAKENEGVRLENKCLETAHEHRKGKE